jgi:NAD(P)H-dependent FMN reductase
MTITVISSSIRPSRLSHRVALSLLRTLAAKGHSAACIDLREENFPLFDGRLDELTAKPASLLRCSETLQSADGIIIVTPEYNGAIPASLKNLLDVLGKPELGGKPIGIATASTGPMGGVRAAYQLQQTILALYAYPQPQMLLAAEVHKNLDEQGIVMNIPFQHKQDTFLKSFLLFAEKLMCQPH